MEYKILIADDNPNHLKASECLLLSRGYSVETATSGEEALKLVKNDPWKFGLAILDYRMNGKNGADTARDILAATQNLYVLIHSGDETQAAAVHSVDAGAVGFIPKSASSDLFMERVALWCKKYEETYLTVSHTLPSTHYAKEIASIGLIGASRALAEIVGQVKKYAPLRETVLLEGETGTGKERIARALHQGSRNLYFPVNCAAFGASTDLMESELFGHVKGSFTGADSQRAGIFRKAEGGTVVLDEIDTLSLMGQQKLLRALREKTVRPVGSEVEYHINFRVVATAKPGLEKRSFEGKFMPDFFERLNILKIIIPPLRERPEDIAPLVAYFCHQYEKDNGIKKRFHSQTVKYLERFDWPRNVAQLENTVRRLCVNTDGDTIQPKHLDEEFFKDRPTVPLNFQLNNIAKEEMIDTMKRALSRREAARNLGIPETSLRRKLKQFGIADPFASSSRKVGADA